MRFWPGRKSRRQAPPSRAHATTAEAAALPDRTESPSSPRSTAPSASSGAFAVVSAVGPPITVATALLLYFGWARTDAQAEAMGIDVSVFGYSAQDYVLRSVNALFLPLIVLLAAGILWLIADRMLVRRLHSTVPASPVVGRTVLVVGVLGALLSVTAVLYAPRLLSLFGPFLIALAVSVAAWGLRLARTARPGRRLPGQKAIENTLVYSLVTLLLFWGTADFAGALGRRIAQEYEFGVNGMPRAEVYSAQRLAITVGGVTETRLGSADGLVYHYTGLRLLVFSGGRYFLLHDGWTIDDGTVVVLVDDGSMRFEFGR